MHVQHFHVLSALTVFCAVVMAGVMAKGDDTMVALVANGESRAAIVLPANAQPEETLAAEELVQYVRRMSGATLPILNQAQKGAESVRVLIGLSLAPGSSDVIRAGGDDPVSFLVRVKPGEVVLAGLSPQGTLFAA